MTKESAKHKAHAKKSCSASNADIEMFLKNQQNIVTRLKSELKAVVNKIQLSDNGTVEKDKCILELQQSLNQRDNEIHKINVNLEQLKEENSRILMEFNFFKEKFYQLETDYDKTLNLQYQENEKLRLQLQQQQTNDNQEIQQLSQKCRDLQQKLHDNINDFAELNKRHAETMQNFEQQKIHFEQQQKEFELYKKQVVEEKKSEEETRKFDLATLRDEIKRKDEALKQCLADKSSLEREKNLAIDELNNKIFRIERAFNQPTKVVQPMVSLPKQPTTTNNSDNSESSNENVAAGLLQVCKPLENRPLQTLSLDENQKVEQIQKQERNYKFKRPLQPPTSSPQSNLPTSIGSQRKRRNQPRQSTAAKKNYNEFSLSSSDEENDNDSNYSDFSQQLWRPNNNHCYVPDTDASEGFAKIKRLKK